MSKTWPGRRLVFARKGRNKAAIHLLKFAAAPQVGKRADEPCGMTAKPGAAGSDEKFRPTQLHTILENLGRVAPQDDLHSGLTPRLDLAALERNALDDRLGAIEKEIKRRHSRGFTRYLLAFCIGAAVILAWRSYGEAAKQMFAAKAPELGWSLETKRMIANWVEQLGWTKRKCLQYALRTSTAKRVRPRLQTQTGNTPRLRGTAPPFLIRFLIPS